MQVILGAGGDIGNGLAIALKQYTGKVRLVARNPKQINGDDELFSGDLTNSAAVMEAVKGAQVAYLTVGLQYNIKIWEAQWLVIMQHVIDACLAHQCPLVFFDNVYMYAQDAIPHMTEDSRIDPPAEKGKLRARLIGMIEAAKQKGLQALIARSADFYGPGSRNSLLGIGVIDNYKKNKRAFWFSDANKIHSFTYTPDAAKGTAILGNTPSAYGQVWHLPTAAEKLTGKDFIEMIASQMNVKPRYFVMNKFLISLLGLFSTPMRELKEMQYQQTQDYFFDSSKFNAAFDFTPTSYQEGIKETIAGTDQPGRG